MESTLFLLGAGTAALMGAPVAWQRLQLSRAKHPSLAGHARMAQRLARWMPGFAYSEEEFFDVDGAPADVRERRRASFEGLGEEFGRRYAQSAARTQQARALIPDLEFTGRYRVPFPFAPVVQARLPLGNFVRETHAMTVEDLDGNRFYDLTGSYGVNVLGQEFYKTCITRGNARAQAIGPLLGPYHPVVLDNAQRLAQISGLDAVSFHMSGTEAVMQAVRLARYHTGRRQVVRFCGAYHGWWDDVQPGPGNPVPARHTFTLRDLDERSLQVIAKRKDIACVLVNPLQALHPNASAPGDSALVDGKRASAVAREAYGQWLRRLREVCTQAGVVLIFDEVFVGFRIALGGAQAYFKVKADLVTYGKTLGGGLPVGVVCGRRDLMKRFRDDKPGDICFARGTFNSHPYVMSTMAEFLAHIETPAVQALYADLDRTWDTRAALLNQKLADAGLPVRVANLSSIWTVHYLSPGRYHWMLQYYLRRHGLLLSWVGSGRIVFSLDYDEHDFHEVAQRFVNACQEMQSAGWWWFNEQDSHRSIRRSVSADLFRRWLARRA